MFPGVNKRQMEQAMRKMGMQQTEIPAQVVIIKTSDKEIIIDNPNVAKVSMMGQLSFQISGTVHERPILSENDIAIKKDDVNLVMEQTNATESEAIDAIEKSNGDLAEAIILLQKK